MLFAIFAYVTSCKKDNGHIYLECTINYVYDNMPYQDEKYVNSFAIYPRRLHLGCSVKNTSNRIVSLPFQTFVDTLCSSYFKITINNSDEISGRVERVGFYDNYNIKPNEIIQMDMMLFIWKYKNGKLSKLPLQDLLKLIKVEYVKDTNDKNLSENEMTGVIFKWNDNLHIMSEKKGDRTIKCGP